MDGETQIFLVDVHTGRQWRLTAPPGRSTAPAWSPDGQRIAFVKSMDQDAQIYVTDADGSGARRLTALPGINLLPVWSPDSGRMAFLSNRDGEMAVYAMRADGSGQRRLAPVYTDLSALPLLAWRPPGVRPG